MLPSRPPRPCPSTPSSFSLAPPLRLLLLPRPLLSPVHPAPLSTPSFSASLSLSRWPSSPHSLSLSPVSRPSLSLWPPAPPPHDDHKSFHESNFYVTTYRQKILEGSTVCEYGENGFFYFFFLFFGGGGWGGGPRGKSIFCRGLG